MARTSGKEEDEGRREGKERKERGNGGREGEGRRGINEGKTQKKKMKRWYREMWG